MILHKVADWINNKDEKLIIGISGHGASGKTTFANNLLKLLGQKNINFMNTDPYIIGSTIRKYTVLDYEYQNEVHRYKMTACHPTPHHISALEKDINMVRDGLDFYTIGNKSTLICSENKVNIVEGMSVAFIDPNLFVYRW